MTRPPFAEFSSLAIRELNAWLDRRAQWSGRFREVLDEHVLPVADKAGLDREEVFQELGDFAGEVYGAALEDLCTRRYADPPENFVDDVLKRRGYRLPPLAKTYLEVMRDSAPGIYEVIAVDPGHGVTLRDLLIEGDAFDVIEISASRQLVQWDRLAARVVMYSGKRVFTGVLVPLRNEKGGALLDDLRKMLHGHAEQLEAGVAGDTFRAKVASALRDLAPMIGGARIAQILESTRRPLPHLANRDGDPYEFVEACYELTAGRRKDIAARLDAEPALRRAGARPAKWDWVGGASNVPSATTTPGASFALDALAEGDAGRVVLASFTLSGGQLTLSVNSRRRMERARALIEPLLAGFIGEPEIKMKTVEEAMAENSAAPKPARRTVPKRIEREITERFLRDHYRKWLDDKLPALGGKTPREAARDFDGREQLVALLKDLENLEARRARETGLSYDAGWLWRELGIEHLRR
jgi:hypothetical protein